MGDSESKNEQQNQRKNQQKNRNNEYLSAHDLRAASSSSDEDDHNAAIVNVPLKRPKLVQHSFSLKSLMTNGTKKSTVSSKSSSLVKNNAKNSIGNDVDTMDLVKLDGAKKKDKQNIDDLFSRFG